MAIELMILEVVRTLPPAKQQEVLDFAQFLISKNGAPHAPSSEKAPADDDLDATLKEIRGEWLKEIDSMEKFERGETDVIA
jgi:Protein of unknown function (DUF2281)